ncbi:MAG TPA: GNAT family N-acetyltransferase [Streptosporangiaceae bacterium]|jgi:predicted acetyltransferase|nr:GNAT family N-acetyltransferase [Streptosporangiaceae bacterium]
MATTFQVRPVTEAELPAFKYVDQHAFNEGPDSERSRTNWLARLELDRTLGAFDGGTLAGVTGVYSFRMRVPGAMAAVAGVSMVAVLPSHRRRGVLSALMRRQLSDVAERGEAVAALFASETAIYGRYGYGRASWHLFLKLARGYGAMAAGAPSDPGLRLRIAEPRSAHAEMGKVYELAMAERPGLYARTEPWWDRLTHEPDSDSAPRVRCVLAEDDAGPRGYALFTSEGQWEEGTFLPDGVLDVHEAITVDPAAAAALWGDLLSRDLITTFRLHMRPVDDPLLHLLADSRQGRPRLSDGLWVRLVEVGRALAQRRYACPVDVVIEVTDEVCPQNQGRWRLTAATTSAPAGFSGTCERTTAPADLVLPVRALGAAYLGGTRLGSLAAAGLVTEVTPGSVAALSTAMSWDPAPWCPMIF